MNDEMLQQYARDPRNTRRRLQEADDIEPAAEVEEKPQPKKSKK